MPENPARWRSSWSKMERIHGQSLLLCAMKSATTSAWVFHLDTMILLLQQRSNITNIVDYAMHGSRHNAVMRVYHTACNVIEAPAQGRIQRVGSLANKLSHCRLPLPFPFVVLQPSGVERLFFPCRAVVEGPAVGGSLQKWVRNPTIGCVLFEWTPE